MGHSDQTSRCKGYLAKLSEEHCCKLFLCSKHEDINLKFLFSTFSMIHLTVSPLYIIFICLSIIGYPFLYMNPYLSQSLCMCAGGMGDGMKN